MSVTSEEEKAHTLVLSDCFSDLTLERDKTWHEEQHNRRQLCASSKRIEQPFFILDHLVCRGNEEYLPDKKQKSNYKQDIEPIWCQGVVFLLI